MSQIPYLGGLGTNLGSISSVDVSAQLAQHANGRSLMYLQWALWNAVTPADYPGLHVDGRWSADTQRALDAVRGGQYGVAKYAPLTGPSVSKVFLTDLLHDYGDFPAPLTVVA